MEVRGEKDQRCSYINKAEKASLQWKRVAEQNVQWPHERNIRQEEKFGVILAF